MIEAIMNWFDSQENDQKERDTLLKYYSSECTVHGAYILTVVIGLFAFVQIIDIIEKYVIYPKFFITVSLSLFITVSIFLLVRAFYWGILASAVLLVREITVEETKKIIGLEPNKSSKHNKITLMFRLHQASIKFFKKFRAGEK